jgi:hypothetical protein
VPGYAAPWPVGQNGSHHEADQGQEVVGFDRRLTSGFRFSFEIGCYTGGRFQSWIIVRQIVARLIDEKTGEALLKGSLRNAILDSLNSIYRRLHAHFQDVRHTPLNRFSPGAPKLFCFP